MRVGRAVTGLRPRIGWLRPTFDTGGKTVRERVTKACFPRGVIATAVAYLSGQTSSLGIRVRNETMTHQQIHTYNRVVDPQADDSLGRIARLVKPGSHVLELGPAMGYFTHYLKESLDCVVDCVECSSEMAEAAAPYARDMWVGDLDEITLSDRFTADSYDYIIAADVLEHLKNPERVLQMCRPLLKQDGRVLLSIPNVAHAALIAEMMEGRFEYRDEGLLDRTHIRFFTRQNILDIFGETGFKVDTIDTITWMPEQTEFTRILEELPPTLRSYLFKNADALTYQFIVTATVGEMSDTQRKALLADDGPARPYFCAKLYWSRRAGGGFTEDQVVLRYPLLGRDRGRIAFDLPPDAAVRRIRFDPADRPGYLHLFSLRLVEKTEDPSVADLRWQMPGEGVINRLAVLEDLHLCPSILGDVFIATSNDPKIFVDLPETFKPAPGAFLSFEAEMTWPTSPDFVVVNAVTGAALDESRRCQAESRRQLAELHQETAGLRATHAGLERQLQDAQARIALRESELQEQGNVRRDLEMKLERQAARIAELDGELAAIHHSKSWRLLTMWRRLKYAILPKPSS